MSTIELGVRNVIREPWDQRLDETEELYRLFLWWRDQVPRPIPSDLALARQFDWSSRAAAWDTRRSLPDGPTAQLQAGLAAQTELYLIMVLRLLARARTDPTFELDAKTTLALGDRLASLELKMVELLKLGGKSDTIDVEGMSLDDIPLEDLQTAIAVFEKLEKK